MSGFRTDDRMKHHEIYQKIHQKTKKNEQKWHVQEVIKLMPSHKS